MKCAVDVAEGEFDRFLQSRDIEIDDAELSDDDKADFEKNRKVLVRAITQGHLEITEDGDPKLILKQPVGSISEFTFHEPTGATYLSMDAAKKEAEMSRMFNLMAELAKVHPAQLSKVAQRDFKIVQALIIMVFQ